MSRLRNTLAPLLITAVLLSMGLALSAPDLPLFGAVVGLTSLLAMVVLADISNQFAQIQRLAPEADLRGAKANIWLHIAPISYVVHLATTGGDPPNSYIYLVPMMLFFYSGRSCWSVLHRVLNRKLYGFFVKGNTSLLIWLPIACAARYFDLYDNADFLYQRLVIGYFVGHLLFMGPITTLLERDIKKLAQSHWSR